MARGYTLNSPPKCFCYRNDWQVFSGTFSNYTSLFLAKQYVYVKDSNHNSAPMSTTHPATPNSITSPLSATYLSKPTFNLQKKQISNITQSHNTRITKKQQSWEPKGTPPMPPLPGNKALLRDYKPPLSHETTRIPEPNFPNGFCHELSSRCPAFSRPVSCAALRMDRSCESAASLPPRRKVVPGRLGSLGAAWVVVLKDDHPWKSNKRYVDDRWYLNYSILL